ncbi:MAG: DUF1634 domain-containing protein [Thermoplasmata archaeon]|nr:DUF1634 domain-containing protein [Thermoplasmata archaeon]
MSEVGAIDTQLGPMAGAHRLNSRVARVLRIGVLLSAVLFAIGVASHATDGSAGLLQTTGPLGPSTVGDAFTHPSALGFALVGAMVLAGTPFLRVLLSFEFFASVRDAEFTALTLFVLALLLATVAVGVIR